MHSVTHVFVHQKLLRSILQVLVPIFERTAGIPKRGRFWGWDGAAGHSDAAVYEAMGNWGCYTRLLLRSTS